MCNKRKRGYFNIGRVAQCVQNTRERLRGDLVHRWSFDGDLTDSSGSDNTGGFACTERSYVKDVFDSNDISLAAWDKVIK